MSPFVSEVLFSSESLRPYVDHYLVLRSYGAKLYGEWLPQHPEYHWDGHVSCLEWYSEGDIASPDYPYGLMLPLV